MTSDIYAISVIFNERGYWSKPYTYKSNIEYAIDSLVVVPTQYFFSVGKVKQVTANPVFDEKIKYKFIVCPVEDASL